MPDNLTSTVLVVDDNEANRDSLRRRLERRGYTVEVAEDGLAALRYLGSHNVDLVLLDVMMPGMSGFEVLERIRQCFPPTRLPVIMATAKDESSDIVTAFDLGANDYVTKPFDFPVVAARVQTQLALKRSIQQVLDLQEELARQNADLEAAAARTRRELELAARVQEAFLPNVPLSMPGTEFAWTCRPCQELAGDSLNITKLDEDHLALYVLDVSGHGVAASLLAVAANRAMSPLNAPDSIIVEAAGDGVGSRPVPPRKVAGSLSRRFSWNAATEQFITMFYAVLNVTTRTLTYVSAGHPPAIVVRRAAEALALHESGLPIGIGEEYEEHSVQLELGDRVYLYSDGVTEMKDADKRLYGKDRLVRYLLESSSLNLADSVTHLMDDLQQWRGGAPVDDDVSVLALELSSGR